MDESLCYALALVNSVASSFAMVSSPVFYPRFFPIFRQRCIHLIFAIVGGTSLKSVCIVTVWLLSYK